MGSNRRKTKFRGNWQLFEEDPEQFCSTPRSCHRVERIFEKDSDKAVFCLLETPFGIPLVMDPSRNDPKWKFPGGKNYGRGPQSETAKDAMVRELSEELGLVIQTDQLEFLAFEGRSTHNYYVYTVNTEDMRGLKQRGDSGELIKFFTLEEILQLPNLLWDHGRLFWKVLQSSTKISVMAA